MSRFNAGDRVVVSEQETLFHSRVPEYARGRTGVIERVLLEFVIPEDDAWGRLWSDGRRETLYRCPASPDRHVARLSRPET